MPDLVSFLDTATEPTEDMRVAMRQAQVGDDVYGRDPTVGELESHSADLLGREAGVFLPSGTMANLAAVLAHTQRGDAVAAEAGSHLLQAETGGLATVAGCMPLPVAGRHGVLDASDVESQLAPDDQHRPRVTLLCVENTHNRAGGTVTTVEDMRALRDVCDRHRLRLHVDGARLFNAAVAAGVAPAELAAASDSVCISLSKGLGAPAGSLLLGSADFVGRARRVRKMLGGGMRQVGVLAAAGLVALEGWPERLAADHRRAARLADRLTEVPGLAPATTVTNIVVCRILLDRLTGPEVVEQLHALGIACTSPAPGSLRFVLHHQIGDGDIEHLATTLAEVLAQPATVTG